MHPKQDLFSGKCTAKHFGLRFENVVSTFGANRLTFAEKARHGIGCEMKTRSKIVNSLRHNRHYDFPAKPLEVKSPGFRMWRSGNSDGCMVATMVGLFLLMVVIPKCGGGGSSTSKKTQKYCNYPGCTNPPSGFWNEGSGYCNRHADQLRNEQKLDDKIKTQGP